MTIRRALVKGQPWGPGQTLAESIQPYMPGNYRVLAETEVKATQHGSEVMIEGEDSAGWTLDGYVLPRLASGLYFGKEVEVTG